MVQQNTELDFSGQTIYAGIDVHLKSWRVSIQLEDVVQKSFSQKPDPAQLGAYLKKHYPNGKYVCCYESGFSGFWAYEELIDQGIECKIAHASDIPTTDKDKRQKTDRRDSRKIVRELSKGSITGIYAPMVEQLQARALIRSRYKVAKDYQRAKNRIKSHLYFYGYHRQAPKTSGHWSKRYLNWLEELAQTKKDAGLSLLLEALLDLRKLRLKALKQIRLLAKQPEYEAQVKLLRSVPGVGLLTAMVILTELIDINRFKNLDHLCSYAGLIPQTHSSGEVDRVGKMTKRGNAQLRKALIESSWVAIRNDPALGLAFRNYVKNRPGRDKEAKNKAIVKMARKLLNRIRHVLRNQTAYEKGIA